MNTDTLRLHYTYGLALLLIVGSGFLIYLKLGEIPAEALIALISATVGAVLAFVFNRESAVGAQRAAERAVAQGAANGTPPPEVK